MNGNDKKNLLKKYCIYQWEVAKELSGGEYTVSRWLRDELSPEHEAAIIKAVLYLERIRVDKFPV